MEERALGPGAVILVLGPSLSRASSRVYGSGSNWSPTLMVTLMDMVSVLNVVGFVKVCVGSFGKASCFDKRGVAKALSHGRWRCNVTHSYYLLAWELKR